MCRRVRVDSTLPILFLTARDGEIDRVLGLELGADDYVDQAVLAPRGRGPGEGHPAPGRGGRRRARARWSRSATASRSTWPGGRPASAARRSRWPPASSTCSRFLADNQGLALTRQQLLDGAWGADWYGDERTVDVHVRQLRKKLGDDLPLATVWGVGYRLG